MKYETKKSQKNHKVRSYEGKKVGFNVLYIWLLAMLCGCAKKIINFF